MRQLSLSQSFLPHPPQTTVDSLSLAAGCGKDHSGELQVALAESITTILYCVGHGIGLVSWNWDCLAVVSGMFQKKVAQKSVSTRTSWCGSRCEVGRGQDLVVRMSIYCRHTLGVGSSIYLSSVPVHIENLDPAAGGLRQLDPTAFSVCAVLENAPSAR